MDQDTQEDKDASDGDSKDDLSMSLFSSARDKRRRERVNKSKAKEMTEDEMMDLALRLSEQEASVTALHRQQEEEAVLKAIQQSMVDQSQPCQTSQSQSLLKEASFSLSSRRKLSYSNKKKASVVDQGAADDDVTPEESGAENEKQKKRVGSPLQEMPDLSQKVSSQTSACSIDSSSAPLDSQNSDLTQIDDLQLPASPVFPQSGYRVEVKVNRLSQSMLETVTSSKLGMCTQDNWTETQKSQKSPPKSVSLEVGQGDCADTQLSPVFGRNTQPDKSPSACKRHISACSSTQKNSGLMFSSQESSADSMSNTFSSPKSPVFPSTTDPSKNTSLLEIPRSPDGGESDQSPVGSPVFGSTTAHVDAHTDEEAPSATDLQVPKGSRSPKQSRKASNTDGCCDIDTITLLSNSEQLNENSKDRNSAEVELTGDMTLVWSDGSVDDNDDVTPTGSPSPVFPEEKPVQTASLNHVAAASSEMSAPNCSLDPQRGGPNMLEDRQTSPGSLSPSTIQQHLPTTEEELEPPSGQEVVSRTLCPYEKPAGRQTVHYYWGVPFCPRGLDPDKYTQVILAQMDVYEKSLKQAQRCLLRKAEWGEAILPQPEKSPSPESPAESSWFHSSRRRGLKRREKTQNEGAESPSAGTGEEEEEEENRKEEEEQREEGKKDEEKNEEDEELMDIDDCEVCPETQLSEDSTQVLMMDTDAGPEISRPLPPDSPETPDIEMILKDASPATVEPQVAAKDEEEEEDVLMDEKMEDNGSGDAGRQTVRNEEVEELREDVEEVTDRRLQRSTSPELEPAVVPHSPETSVECPICQASFPVSRIEMHAAYCDGEDRKSEANCFQVSPKPRRKRTRRGQTTSEETSDPFTSEKNQEKCYICQKDIPLQDYSRHTELCIHRQKGNLLSALEQTESRDSEAGPSGSKLDSVVVIDLLDDDDEEDEVKKHISTVRVSNSPIRSFTPISEATDCLVDFKKQHRAKRATKRRR